MTIAYSMIFGACTQEIKKAEETAPIIGRSEIKVPDGRMTPEVLYSMARVSDALLSPDGSKVLYGVTFMSIEQNKGNRELFTVNVDGSDKKQITHTSFSEQNAVWVDGGNQIAFLSSESGSSQIWVMNADGNGRKQISSYDGGINGFILSPDEKKVLFISDIKYGERTSDI